MTRLNIKPYFSLRLIILTALICCFLFGKSVGYSAQNAFDDLMARNFTYADNVKIRKMQQAVLEFKKKVLELFEKAVNSGRLQLWQIMDRFYIPMPLSHFKKVLKEKFTEAYRNFPVLFTTEYTEFFEQEILPIQKQFVKEYGCFYIAAVDINGYCASHNANKPLTGNMKADIAGSRSRRMYNDVMGLRASRNTTKEILLLDYIRDTGERFADMSSPIIFRGKHWGAVRLGFRF